MKNGFVFLVLFYQLAAFLCNANDLPHENFVKANSPTFTDLPEATPKRFAFELYFQQSKENSYWLSRILFERNNDDYSIAVLNPYGTPVSLLQNGVILLNDGQRLVRSEGFPKVEFVKESGKLGCHFSFNPVKEPNAPLFKFDTFEVILRPYIEKSSVSQHFSFCNRYEFTRPSGAMVRSWFENKPDGNLLQQVCVTGRGKDLEVSVGITNVYVDCEPPRTFLKRTLNLPQFIPKIDLGSVPKYILGNHLNWEFAYSDPACEILSRMGKIDQSLVLSEANLLVSKSILRDPDGTTEKLLTHFRHLGVSYLGHLSDEDIQVSLRTCLPSWRPDAAYRTEITFGSEASNLRTLLKSIALNRNLDLFIRLDSLDLHGIYGEPVYSAQIKMLEEQLSSEANDILLLGLAAFRARCGFSSQADFDEVNSLHRWLNEPRLHTQMLESLAIFRTLKDHPSLAEKVWVLDENRKDHSRRRIAAICTCDWGRNWLLNHVRDGKLKATIPLALEGLGRVMKPRDEYWNDLFDAACKVALDSDQSAHSRLVAIGIAQREPSRLTKQFADSFFHLAEQCDELPLLGEALQTRKLAGMKDKNIEYFRTQLASERDETRLNVSQLISVTICMEAAQGEFSAANRELLGQLLSDTSVHVQKVGLISIPTLCALGYAIDPNVRALLEGIAMNTKEADVLAATYAAFASATDKGEIPVPLKAGQSPANWIHEDPSRAKRHLLEWLTKWKNPEKIEK